MDDRYDELWDKALKNAKILKLKAIRSWHRFDKQFGVSRGAKKLALALALKLIALAAPNAQVSLHAQTAKERSKSVAAVVTKSSAASQLLAKANEASTTLEFSNFMEENRDLIIERQKQFALAYWNVLQEDVDITQREGVGALRKMYKNYKKYGLSINPAYFCATGALGAYIQTLEKSDFAEYELLLDCLTNPNSCAAIIKDLKKHFGDKKETNDIPKTLSEIYKKNPYAVCIVFPHSKRSQSGYHYTTAFSNAVAVDTLLTPEDSIKGKAARFNRTAIADIDEYYTGEKKRGYVFDLTEMIGNYQIFQMYMEYIEKTPKIMLPPAKTFPDPSKSFQPVATLTSAEKKGTSWQAVSNRAEEKPKIPRKTSYQPRRTLPKRGERLS